MLYEDRQQCKARWKETEYILKTIEEVWVKLHTVKTLLFQTDFTISDPLRNWKGLQIWTCHSCSCVAGMQHMHRKTHFQPYTLVYRVTLWRFWQSFNVPALSFAILGEIKARWIPADYYKCFRKKFYINYDGHSLETSSLPQGKVRPQASDDCIQHLSNQARRHRRHGRISSSQQHQAVLRRIRQLQKTVWFWTTFYFYLRFIKTRIQLLQIAPKCF